MDGDIEEIEQFLNQIELLVQSRSPLGRKTADELFKRLKALEHECENESDKDRLAPSLNQSILSSRYLEFFICVVCRFVLALQDSTRFCGLIYVGRVLRFRRLLPSPLDFRL